MLACRQVSTDETLPHLPYEDRPTRERFKSPAQPSAHLFIYSEHCVLEKLCTRK